MCIGVTGYVLVVGLFALWVGSFPRYEFAMLSAHSTFMKGYEYYHCEWVMGRACKPAERALVLRGMMTQVFDAIKLNYTAEGLSHQKTQYTTRDGKSLSLEITTPLNSDKKNLPVLIYIHGGGWVMGQPSPVPFAKVVRDYIVFSPAYRLAPEHAFPTAVEDCEDAVRWIVKNADKFGGDASHLVLSGTSAGGNLAASISLVLRDAKKTDPSTPKVDKLILDIPLVSWMLDDESSVMQVNSYIWSTGLSLVSRLLYLPNWKDYADPRASPLLASTHEGLPPTLIIACDLDPFFDQAIQYHKKLVEAKVTSKLVTFANTPHAVTLFPESPLFSKERAEYIDSIKNFLKR